MIADYEVEAKLLCGHLNLKLSRHVLLIRALNLLKVARNLSIKFLLIQYQLCDFIRLIINQFPNRSVLNVRINIEAICNGLKSMLGTYL